MKDIIERQQIMKVRQAEAAKRLRQLADILEEPPASRIRCAAELMAHPDGLPAETGFVLVMMTDILLGGGPMVGP